MHGGYKGRASPIVQQPVHSNNRRDTTELPLKGLGLRAQEGITTDTAVDAKEEGISFQVSLVSLAILGFLS